MYFILKAAKNPGIINNTDDSICAHTQKVSKNAFSLSRNCTMAQEIVTVDHTELLHCLTSNPKSFLQYRANSVALSQYQTKPGSGVVKYSIKVPFCTTVY